jgi:hypothetical protein
VRQAGADPAMPKPLFYRQGEMPISLTLEVSSFRCRRSLTIFKAVPCTDVGTCPTQSSKTGLPCRFLCGGGLVYFESALRTDQGT